MSWSKYRKLPFPLVPHGILSVLQHSVLSTQASRRSLPKSEGFGSSTLKVDTLSVYNCLGLFFWGSLRIKLIFPLVIHSGIFASSKNLFNSIASLWWMDVNFINQTLCTPLCHGILPVSITLSVTLADLMCMFISELSSSLCNSFFGLFIVRSFDYVLPVPIFLQKLYGGVLVV